ncbi:MAG TPA: thiamine-phosphate kinase [Methylomirabilota bacterium]|nr:thiamine-phosphate kinase [Methylomirabilota bacterium]
MRASEPPERVGLGRLGERGLIRRIRRSEAATGRADGLEVGIGDDTAVMTVPPGHRLLATTDLLIENVHFRTRSAAPADIGWKALAVNLSDIAAMGGIPRWALVALAVPASTEPEAIDAFYAGMAAAGAPHGVTVVGGDTSASPSGWMVNVTLLGVHPGAPRLRSHARPGDAVAVTGRLGGSGAGLHALEIGADQARAAGLAPGPLAEIIASHLRPQARVAEGRWLGEAVGVHAMMDCSDGLATDLEHICRESGVGARVRLDDVPIAVAARAAGEALGVDPRDWAVGGGEDYELLLTCEPDAATRLADGLGAATGTALTVIGRIEGPAGAVVFVDAAGQPVTVRSGYQHFQD